MMRTVSDLLPKVTCSRTVLERPYVFPDGLTLPVGTRFGFPTMAMQNDADLSFKGFRFAKGEATTPEHEENNASWGGATTMSTTNLA